MATIVSEREAVTRDFQRIPGVGPSIANDLWSLGYRSVDDLAGENAETMYSRFCALQNTSVDRCLLYVFRCAVYFAGSASHDPEKLRWWNWRDA